MGGPRLQRYSGTRSGLTHEYFSLILNSVIRLFKGAVKDWPTRIIYLAVLLLAAAGAFLPMPAGVLGAALGYLCSPVLLVILSGVAGVLIRRVKGERKA